MENSYGVWGKQIWVCGAEKGLLERSHFGIRNKLGKQRQGWGSEAKFEREKVEKLEI